ncbi:MAG: hypothetical protein QXU45_05605 [Candidatus Bathyarchaeia archaeon]
MLAEISSLLTPGEIIEKSWRLKETYVFATNKRLIIRGKIWRESHRNPVKALLTQDLAYEHVISIEHMTVKPKKGVALILFIPFFCFLAIWFLSKSLPILWASIVFLGFGIYCIISLFSRSEFIYIHTMAGMFSLDSTGCKETFEDIFRYIRSKNPKVKEGVRSSVFWH